MFRRNYLNYKAGNVTDYSAFGPIAFSGIDDFSDLPKVKGGVMG